MPLATRLACFALLCGSLPMLAQPPAGGGAQETNRTISNGGVTVPGWKGQVDASAEKQRQSVNDAKLAPEAGGMRVTTGPAGQILLGTPGTARDRQHQRNQAQTFASVHIHRFYPRHATEECNLQDNDVLVKYSWLRWRDAESKPVP